MMHMFFVKMDQIEKEYITIIGDDVNHINNVLRISKGEEIEISDGQGSVYRCTIGKISKDQIECNILSRRKSEQELPTKIYLFQGLPKQDKFEFIIQKAVELGVFEIIPVMMSRSIAKINTKAQDKKLDRYNKISLAAAKQSHRGNVPEVKELMTFTEAIEYGGKLDHLIVPYEKKEGMDGSKKVFLDAKKYSSIGIYIGPEGGFEEKEVEKLIALGASIVSLGKRILRTETASLATLSILMFNLEEDSL